MRKIFRRFRRAPVAPQVSQSLGEFIDIVALMNLTGADETTAAVGDHTRLPTELLILIVYYVRSKSDLLILCRASKTLSVICTPRIYQVVHFSTHYTGNHYSVDSKGIPYLYISLQNTCVSKVVTEVRITLWGDEKCTRRMEMRSVHSPSPDECACDAHDKALGKAILGLHNLLTLDIQCELCRGKHAHDFLLHRDMPRLTELSFRCFGSSAKERGVPACDALLKSPCMRTITALLLECDYDKLIGSSSGTRQFINSVDFVPDLRILSHDTTDFFTDLVAARRIERLCVQGPYSTRLHKKIPQNSGSLTHLFMVDIISYLRYITPADWPTYRHLTHIGTITFSRREEQVACDEMGLFQPLHALETMEINHMSNASLGDSMESLDTHMNPFFVPTSRFFTLLDQQHPHLRRVVFVVRWFGFMAPHSFREPVVWEKEKVWSSRPGPKVAYWDMLHDRLDKMLTENLF